MINSKKEIIETLKLIPDTKSVDEIFDILYFKSQLMLSENDIKNGKFITLEESEKEMEALYESYDVAQGSQRYTRNL